MENNALFDESVASAAAKILEEAAKGEVTSWELKNRLRLSSSRLYLALGWLLGRGRIKLSPDELTYKVALPAQQEALEADAPQNTSQN
jgi:hypothetical protein